MTDTLELLLQLALFSRSPARLWRARERENIIGLSVVLALKSCSRRREVGGEQYWHFGIGLPAKEPGSGKRLRGYFVFFDSLEGDT